MITMMMMMMMKMMVMMMMMMMLMLVNLAKLSLHRHHPLFGLSSIDWTFTVCFEIFTVFLQFVFLSLFCSLIQDDFAELF